MKRSIALSSMVMILNSTRASCSRGDDCVDYLWSVMSLLARQKVAASVLTVPGWARWHYLPFPPYIWIVCFNIITHWTQWSHLISGKCFRKAANAALTQGCIWRTKPPAMMSLNKTRTVYLSPLAPGWGPQRAGCCWACSKVDSAVLDPNRAHLGFQYSQEEEIWDIIKKYQNWWFERDEVTSFLFTKHWKHSSLGALRPALLD